MVTSSGVLERFGPALEQVGRAMLPEGQAMMFKRFCEWLGGSRPMGRERDALLKEREQRIADLEKELQIR